MNHLKLAAFCLGVSLVTVAAFIIRLDARAEPMWLMLPLALVWAVGAGWHFCKHFQR